MVLRAEHFNICDLANSCRSKLFFAQYKGLTPNKTRRAQCANWILYYREALFGKSLEELKKARERDVAAENEKLRRAGKMLRSAKGEASGKDG